MCQVHLSDEGMTVTSFFVFDVETKFPVVTVQMTAEGKNMFLKMDCLCFGPLYTSSVSFKLTEVSET